MAREWALRGLSEEELRPKSKLDPPKTPRGKLENYWYHYKWHTIVAIAIVAVLAVMIGQIITKDDPDYLLILATQNAVSETSIEKLEASLEAYGKDIDEDGKVEVLIDSISFSGDPQFAVANKQKFLAHLSAGDIMFFILDKETYETTIMPQETDEYQFYDKIDLHADNIEGGGRYWDWKNDKIRNSVEMQLMPENLYFGVRSISGTSSNEKSKKMNKQSMELLKAFITKTPLEKQKGTASGSEK